MDNVDSQHYEIYSHSLNRCFGNPSFFIHFAAEISDPLLTLLDPSSLKNMERLYDWFRTILAAAELRLPGGKENTNNQKIWIDLSRKAKLLGLNNDFYCFCFESLIAAARKYDSRFSQDVETAWRNVLSPCIALLVTQNK